MHSQCPPAQLCLQRLHQPSLCLPTCRHTAQCSSLSVLGAAPLLQRKTPAPLCICKAVLQHLDDTLQAPRRFRSVQELYQYRHCITTDIVSAMAAYVDHVALTNSRGTAHVLKTAALTFAQQVPPSLALQ